MGLGDGMFGASLRYKLAGQPQLIQVVEGQTKWVVFPFRTDLDRLDDYGNCSPC